MADKEKDATKLTKQNPEDISMVSEETMTKLEQGLKEVYSTPSDSADEPEADSPDEPAAKEVKATPDKDEDTKDETTPEKKADENEVQFPDAHYRAMIHQGWTDKEIEDLIENNPDKALALGKKMYDVTNQLSEQFSAAGRKPVQKPVDSAKPRVEFKGLDAKKMADRLGIDVEAAESMVSEINGALKSQQEELNKLQEQVRESEVKASNIAVTPEDKQLEKEVDQFFNKDFLKVYGEFYGTENALEDLTHKQANRRIGVLTRADEILAGASLSGRQMSIQDALGAAHLQVSKDISESIMRKGIKASLTKRAKSMTLRPVGGVVPVDKPKTPKEREKALEARVGDAIKNIKW